MDRPTKVGYLQITLHIFQNISMESSYFMQTLPEAHSQFYSLSIFSVCDIENLGMGLRMRLSSAWNVAFSPKPIPSISMKLYGGADVMKS